MTAPLRLPPGAKPGGPANWLRTDRSNWQWRGLQFFACNLGGGPMVDLVSGDVATRGGTADPYRATGLGDIESDFDGSGDYYEWGALPPFVPTEPYTVVWECVLDAFTAAFPSPIVLDKGGGANPYIATYSNSGSYKDLHWGFRGGELGPNRRWTFPADVSVTGERHYVALAFYGGDRSVAGNYDLWVNGHRAGSSTAGTFLAVYTAAYRIGRGHSGSDFDGGVRQVRVYDWTWQEQHAQEFFRLRGNIPFPAPWYFVPATTGGSHALLADDLSTSPDLSEPSISQVHALAGEDLSGAAALGEPSVWQLHVLAGEDLSTTCALGTPTLNEAHALAADDLSTGPSLSIPALSQGHVLAADDLAVAPVLGAPAPGQVHALAASDVAAAPVLSEPVISIGAVQLFAEDLGIVVQLGQPALGQVHVLAGEGLATTSALALGALGQVHGLAADDIVGTALLSLPGLNALGLGTVTRPRIEMLPGYSVAVRVPTRTIRVSG